MKLTIFVLLLPVMIFVSTLLATQGTHTFHPVLFFLWLLSSVNCLVWGFYISRRSRLLGWLCVGVGVIPLIMMMWPVVSDGGVKFHTEIETHVA